MARQSGTTAFDVPWYDAAPGNGAHQQPADRAVIPRPGGAQVPNQYEMAQRARPRKDMKDDDFMLVEGGQFLMGDISGDFARDSRPVHRVVLGAFSIARFPVTQKLWSGIMANNPSNKKGAMSPVEMVSWFDAVDFCNRLWLPTEAEWKYAARSGKHAEKHAYAGGDDINEVAWYKGNSMETKHEVGMKKPNRLGICDMSGNVWEWCWDKYGYYPKADTADPRGPERGEARVYRGGSYIDFEYGCSVSIRGKRNPGLRQVDIGFRLARSGRTP